jgi:A/G-specific adenine glycosylase
MPTRQSQPWHGTDRQVRGLIMGQLREADAPIPLRVPDAVPAEQFERALASLLADGLVTDAGGGTFSL